MSSVHECLHYVFIIFHSAVFPIPDSASICDQPGRVAILSQKVTSSSFHITWNQPTAELCIDLHWHHPPVEKATGPITAYILEYSESGSDTPPHIISLSAGVKEYTAAGLKPHTEYRVKVAAENTAGRGPFCERLVKTAPDSELYLQCPSNMHSYTILVNFEPFKYRLLEVAVYF